MLRRNIAANFISQGWAALMGLAFIPVYLSQLGAEAYGLIGVFAVLQAWLSLMDLGITPTINREMARFGAGQHSAQSIRDLLRTLELICFGAALAAALVVTLSAPWLSTHWLQVESLPSATVEQALAAIGAVVALRLPEGLFRGALLGQERQVWLGANTAALATLRWGGAALVLHCVNPSITTFFLWQALVSLAGALWLAHATYNKLPAAPRKARFDLEQLKAVHHFAGGVALTMLLAVLLTQLDKILLSGLLSLSQLGYYTLAGTVAGGLYQLTAPLFQAFYPRLSALVATGEDAALRRNYHLGAQLVSVAAIPAALMMAFFAEPLLLLWTGDPPATAAMAPLLSLLAIGTLLNCLMNMPMALLLAYGQPSFIVRTNTIAVAILVPAILIVAPRFGASGAAWIWLTLNAGYVLIAVHFMHHRLLPQEKWRWYGAAILLPTLGCLPVLIACTIFSTEYSASNWSWFELGLCAIAAYVSTVLATPVTRTFVIQRLQHMRRCRSIT